MSGVVFFAGYYSKLKQNIIIIKSEKYKLFAIYRDISKFKTSAGAYVLKGQDIGLSHNALIFEVRDFNGKALDPLLYLSSMKKKKVTSDFHLKFHDFMSRHGFKPHEIPTMFCIALWESAFNRKAINNNTNKTQDTGLFQINDIWLPACKMTRSDLLDAGNNAKCARLVLKKQGFNAWVTFNKFAHFCKN